MSTANPPTSSTGDPAATADSVAFGSPGSPDPSIDALAAAAAGFASAFDRWSNRKAAEAGLGAQRLRLLNAVHCHGPQKMADLAGALAVTPRNVTALVDGLEADGLHASFTHQIDVYIAPLKHEAGSKVLFSNIGFKYPKGLYFCCFGLTVSGVDSVLRFPGQQSDAGTGLSYNYYRDYDPSLGRYVQSDPIGLGGGVNTYAYVGGNPTGWVDRQGLAATACEIPEIREEHPDLCSGAEMGDGGGGNGALSADLERTRDIDCGQSAGCRA